MIWLPVNEFLSGIAKIPARKDFSHRVDSSHSSEAWKVFVIKTEQVRNPFWTNVFFDPRPRQAVGPRRDPSERDDLCPYLFS
jgi:hypothetical protein